MLASPPAETPQNHQMNEFREQWKGNWFHKSDESECKLEALPGQLQLRENRFDRFEPKPIMCSGGSAPQKVLSKSFNRYLIFTF
jgi:hypothetical protein